MKWWVGARCQQVGERAGSILWSSVEYPGHRPQNKNMSPWVYWQLQLNLQPWEWPPACGDFIYLSIRIGLGAWLKIKCRKTTVGSSPTSGTNGMMVQISKWVSVSRSAYPPYHHTVPYRTKSYRGGSESHKRPIEEGTVFLIKLSGSLSHSRDVLKWYMARQCLRSN